ncbi:MAG: zinc-binding alcohol dehydrogenase family protein [Sciscionella sp.]
MATYSPAPTGWLFDVPDELDDVTAAALPNAGVSAWLSLSWRAALQPGESVLVLGATGVTGKLAMQAPRRLGAKRVVAAGRNPRSLAQLAGLGADATIQLATPRHDLVESFAVAGHFDVVIDYLWCTLTEALIAALTSSDLGRASGRTRLVQVGEMASADITLPAAALRASGLEILGNGTSVLPPPELMTETFGRILRSAVAGDLGVDARAVPPRDVERVWNRDVEGSRLVLVP